MLRIFRAILVMLVLLATIQIPVLSQETVDPRAATGGAQTLEDIMARQRGESIEPRVLPDTSNNRNGVAGNPGQLEALGTQSDADFFRAFRDGSNEIVSSSGIANPTVMQDGGMFWLKFREGPLRTYGGYLLLFTLVVLALFFLVRGKIKIEGEKTGIRVLRFKWFERFSHWMLAGSFIALGISGLISLFGRVGLLPMLGSTAFSRLAMFSKLVHNYISWVFMLALIFITVLWLVDNLPKRHDFTWLLKAGGLFTKGVHPPAGKFNAGEKIIFWLVLVMGLMVAATGLSLLFPFQLNMFGPTFSVLNATGIPQLIGFGEINAVLAPQEEMQFTQLWHAIVAFVYMAIILAHIYLGSIGMEGSLESMTKGDVEKQWAKEHHDLWLEEIEAKANHNKHEENISSKED